MTNGNDLLNEPRGYRQTSTKPNSTLTECSGLTKREYFAAMAMQGMLASEGPEHGFTDIFDLVLDEDGHTQYDVDGELVRTVRETADQRRAAYAVEQADALIDALNTEAT